MKKGIAIFLVVVALLTIVSCSPKKETCTYCDGTGHGDCYYYIVGLGKEAAGVPNTHSKNCDTCHGTNRDPNKSCGYCDGTGYIVEE